MGYKVQLQRWGTWGDYTKKCTTKAKARKKLLMLKKRGVKPLRVKKCPKKAR